MATDSGSNSAVVAIFAIMLLLMVGGFIAWQTGVFDRGGGGKSGSTLEIDINR
jgi:hypothetical protein